MGDKRDIIKLKVVNKVNRELLFFVFVSSVFERFLYSTDSEQTRYAFTPCVTEMPGAYL